ncbi:class I SAM-dependent methyltransferase [Campylobacter geochelonis]|uniref:Putative methyltransferase n=1 Tax=Campylobacter geochelonis TaxID=1780362 RepID=A0A128EC99_9BACT|nr:class I SAM-dependent methyltransferase [Campylobacter geochelonis]QKF72150.1 methyltransferase [Campylobacter geochelonis]CZE46626.1 putative methyltransferase [Campylobacter geochelonis]
MNNSVEMVEKTYEEEPYISYQYPQSSPNRQWVAGFVFGLNAPDIQTARVLELGCSMGGNLMPLASRYKKAKFIGVDLSKKQISVAKEIAKELSLKNIEFYAKDVTTITKDFGEFDYIIVHGVYSWVPQEVKEAIMRICGECLSQNGLAYISYNTYPGWKGKEILRDIMLFNMDKDTPASQKTVNDGIDMLNYMRQNVGNNFIRKILDDSFSGFESHGTSYILHEYFEIFNQPNYFHEVASLAKANGLEYLSESEYTQNIFPPISNEVKERLLKKCAGDRVKFEQYIDFVINKTFRQTIFCKKENAENIKVDFTYKFEELNKLNLAGKFSYNANIQRYVSQTQVHMPVGISKLLNKITDAYPSSVNVGEFVNELKDKSQEELQRIYQGVAFLLSNNVCYISPVADKFLSEIPKKPKLNSETLALAKYKVRVENLDNISFFTPRGETFGIDKNLDHRILALLDGSKDVDGISKEIFKMSKDGIFSFVVEEMPVVEDEEILKQAKERANFIVSRLFFEGMLVK